MPCKEEENAVNEEDELKKATRKSLTNELVRLYNGISFFLRKAKSPVWGFGITPSLCSVVIPEGEAVQSKTKTCERKLRTEKQEVAYK
jgi:hypothetical protein